MDRTAVSSSHLSSIGYDPALSILEIEFNDGSVYQYVNVPQSEFDGLMSSGSHGTYFHANIRKRYSYSKI
jgi:hypothetical protein